MATVNSWTRINALPHLDGAFALLGGKWGNNTFGPSSTITISWNFTTLYGIAMTQAPYQAAVQDALAVWENAANIRFQKVADNTSADIQFHWNSIDGAGNILGQTYYYGAYPSPTLSVMQNMYVEFDTSDYNPNLGQSTVDAGDFFVVALHEIGHALGLDHPDDREQTMFAQLVSRRKSLGDGDVEGIQLLYGPAVGQDTKISIGSDGGETISHTSQSSSMRVMALGGADTIRTGSGNDEVYSGAGNDNVAVNAGNDLVLDAFGNDQIAGGAGNDILRDFSGTNTLNGGDGDDKIVGGFGNDVLIGGSGSDYLIGDGYAQNLFFGSDRIDGGTGNDFLSGGHGADVFVFRPGDGNDVIGRFTVRDIGTVGQLSGPDFEPGIDLVDIRAFGLTSAAEVTSSLRQVGASTIFERGSDSILFRDVVLSELSSDEFQWV